MPEVIDREEPRKPAQRKRVQQPLKKRPGFSPGLASKADWRWSSEEQLQGKLDLAWEISSLRQSKFALVLAKRRTRHLQVGAVQYVESFRVELQVNPLIDLDILKQGKVKVAEIRTAEGV